MVPMKTSSVFKSRWMALIWAAGIVWFAYDTASSQPQAPSNSTSAERASDPTGTAIGNADMNKVADALNSF